mmetsp:Transcript_11589/g.16532  ORF Transcript_11589/g.16532 Transcript_11589/m.16532 type:complete len:85 (-) Transcript_11589:202-456(-)
MIVANFEFGGNEIKSVCLSICNIKQDKAPVSAPQLVAQDNNGESIVYAGDFDSHPELGIPGSSHVLPPVGNDSDRAMERHDVLW